MDELFALADIVSLHAPSIPETRHMVGAAQLRRPRDGVQFGQHGAGQPDRPGGAESASRAARESGSPWT